MSLSRESRESRIERIIADVGVEVEVIVIPDGIPLHESTEARVVHPGLVIVQTGLG